MKTFSSVDLYAFVKESQFLVNNRIETFYFENGVFYLKLYVKGKGHFFITTKLGSYIYLGKEKIESNHPTSFILYLRKYLKNTFLISIEAIESERILKLTLSKKEGKKLVEYHIYIEVFIPGNVIFCNTEGIILNSLLQKSFKDRAVRAKREYILPPKTDISLLNSFDSASVLKKAKQSYLTIVKFLAIECSLGGKYSELFLQKYSIDKEILAKEIDKKLFENIHNFLMKQDIESSELKKKDEVKDFLPFNFGINNAFIKSKSFSDSLCAHFSKYAIKEDIKNKEFNKALKKLKNRLKKQLQDKEKREIEIEVLQKKGEKLYKEFQKVENILQELNKAFEEKGEEFIKEKIKADPKLSFITKFNSKNKTLEIDFEKLKIN